MGKVAVIRTSDRGAFRRCRRKWAFGSALRRNRGPLQSPGYFWIGTGCHFALEDFHGHNHYKHPAEAFRAFTDACKRLAGKNSGYQLPDDWEEQYQLGQGLLDYYVEWLQYRNPLKTFVYEGEYQCEVRVQYEIPLEMFPPWVAKEYDKIIYDATFDRVIEDEDGLLWILDYKFFKSFQNDHLDYDPQISAYMWIGSALYGRPIEGFIYQQHLKATPELPRILSSGKISSDKNQRTTHRLYKHALEELYGNIDKAPNQNKDVLNLLAAEESEDRDKFIRREKTRRSEQQLMSTGTNILHEIEEMLNPELALYPNPTKDCSWDCSFNDICIMMDREDDWEYVLEETTNDRSEERDEWRQLLR